MNKMEFLNNLSAQISMYPSEETNKSLDYYAEIIEDRIEDGMTEEEAVASLGFVEEIAEQIKCELPFSTIVKYKAKEKTNGGRVPVWAIILIVLGSPIWIAIGAVVLSVYIVLWTMNLALWMMDLGLAMGGASCIVSALVMIIKGSFASVAVYFGVALILVGISIIVFLGCLYISKGLIAGSVWFVKQIKKGIIGK